MSVLYASLFHVYSIFNPLHMPPIVKMPHLVSIEVGHSRQVAPLLKAHFLQQPEAGLIAFQYNRKNMPDLQRGTSRQRVPYQSCPDPLAMISWRKVITDLCCKAER